MRVLVLANIDTGLYKFRKELLEALVRENEVYFCVPSGEFVESIKAIGCKFILCTLMDRHGTNPLKELKLISFYKKTLKDIKPDIVFTYTIKPNAYGGMACASLEVPYVANITGLGTAIENGGLMQKISLALYKFGLKKAQKVFFQNTENRDFMLKHGVVKSPYGMLPGSGVNLELHKLEEYPTEDEGIRFLFVGRIMKDKGVNELIKAIEIVKEKFNAVILDVVGDFDGSYGEMIKNAEDKGLLKYHGFQKDIHPFMKISHCTVLPSYHEGTANVLLEAASTGRPVIATLVPGCKETFDEGVTGLGCEVKNSESLAEAMIKFIELPYSKKRNMGLAGRTKMEREFDRNIVVNAYLKEISRLTN